MYTSTSNLEFKTSVFADTFFSVIKNNIDTQIWCYESFWIYEYHNIFENSIHIYYKDSYNKKLKLILTKEENIIKAETTTDYKDRENSSEAYAFVDAFKERMFEIYFLKE